MEYSLELSGSSNNNNNKQSKRATFWATTATPWGIASVQSPTIRRYSVCVCVAVCVCNIYIYTQLIYHNINLLYTSFYDIFPKDSRSPRAPIIPCK